MEVETSRANNRDAGNTHATKTTAAAPKQATVTPKPIAANGAKPTPPPKGIKIITNIIEDFRKLNSYLIKSNIPFHTFALEEERKIKAVIKGVPIEIETESVKDDLERQGYPVTAVHRMHRRDGTALGLVLAILERCDQARDIFKNLYNICGLSGIKAEAPYKRGMPGQCHRCQLYGHAAANCYAQPRCVKCLVPHWTRDCDRNKESGGEPYCCNCGQNHTAYYGGCPVASKPKVFPPLGKTNRPPTRANATPPIRAVGAESFRPAPNPAVNQWKTPLPWKKPKTTKETNTRECPPLTSRRAGTAASALGEDITIITSILQVVRSAEVSDLAAKFRKAKHGVDRLRIILDNQELISRLENI
ncbi:Nucleic-acid-binding protein from transposon X-element [Eumeta japonica]|uniref:Nucleic-acid-binding protein from transposon X-element n=1 Tax=Eumeta variegata TaxID=151549 RepID=A0A4C1V6E2_EUMVA|nr:Nucleic-acid-binding protein from transposon X-element [Eumeta japonica]